MKHRTAATIQPTVKGCGVDDDQPSDFNVHVPVILGDRPPVHVTVHCGLGSDAAFGLWCDQHALPGRYGGTVYALSERGVTVMGWSDGCDCEDD
ncbi:hypothetical protein ABZ215_25065 [Amycolatopsis sp. NPDC006131]|uniref:hypothetical protein n=1 Tax=Amycolatopsis sp. NPDC006131 TaxID=3156731 RepID=UPI0033A141E9